MKLSNSYVPPRFASDPEPSMVYDALFMVKVVQDVNPANNPLSKVMSVLFTEFE
jgi:hypothetical protein